MKSGAGTPSSFHFGEPFLATAIPKGPAPDPPAIGHGITWAVALAIVAAYCPAIRGVGTPTYAGAPAKGSWSRASWTGSSATGSMAGAAACLTGAPGDRTKSQDPPAYGREVKSNRSSTATCSAAVLEGATRPLISTIPTGAPTPVTAGTSSFPWPDTKGILRTRAQFLVCPIGPRPHVAGCHQWVAHPPH